MIILKLQRRKIQNQRQELRTYQRWREEPCLQLGDDSGASNYAM